MRCAAFAKEQVLVTGSLVRVTGPMAWTLTTLEVGSF